MYCKRCYAELPQSTDDAAPTQGPWLGGEVGQIPYAPKRIETTRCPRCLKKFDPTSPKTYLTTLALGPSQIIVKILLTTLFGIGAAYVVAFHQLAATSGH